MEISCERCSDTFFAHGNQRYCKTCGPIVAAEKRSAYQEKLRAAYKAVRAKLREKDKRKCVVCKKPTNRKPPAKYCLECAVKVSQEKTRSYMRKVRAELKTDGEQA